MYCSLFIVFIILLLYIFHTTHTVLHIIKLNLFLVPVRLHSGSGKLIFRRYFTILFDI